MKPKAQCTSCGRIQIESGEWLERSLEPPQGGTPVVREGLCPPCAGRMYAESARTLSRPAGVYNLGDLVRFLGAFELPKSRR